MARTLAWVDGVNSVVMGYMALLDDPSVEFVHCDLGNSVDPDSHRFIDDAERWFGKPITRLKSARYADIDEVFEHRKYHAGINGAPCTGELKFAPRLDYQLPSDTHLWGYTADKRDAKRFANMQKEYPLLRQRAPLIEWRLTKADTHYLLDQVGIKRPYVYEIGFPNGNCIGCVKASSPNYWALIRKYFPEVFARRAEQSRRFGSRLTRIKGVRVFIDEIPADWPITMRGQHVPACGFLCEAES